MTLCRVMPAGSGVIVVNTLVLDIIASLAGFGVAAVPNCDLGADGFSNLLTTTTEAQS
jgi:hypothetical protein